ncbi:MAG: RIP metalloprotease RseP [Pseudomonadota bacterium]
MDILGAPMQLLSFIWGTIVPFVFVLTIVVFFHELGHFLVARWNRVKVDTFAVGFGPELGGFNDRHGTRWKFCAIPLGGYVKFFGDEDASSKPDVEALSNMTADEREGAFEHKALWRRASVVAAGPIANFILAIVIYCGLFMYFGETKIAPIIGQITPDSAASQAGFKVGDRVLEIDGSKVTSFQDISGHTMVSSDRPLEFLVERNGEMFALTAVPRMTERKDRFGNVFQSGLVGIGPERNLDNLVTEPLGPGGAFVKSLDATWMIVSRTYHFIRELIAGKQDASQLRGPIGIGQMTSQVATLGVLQLLELAAALSVSIGLMNLLPIPVLDGGHLVFYALEGIRGKALSVRSQNMAFRIGLTCILMMMLFATSNDLVRIFGIFG